MADNKKQIEELLTDDSFVRWIEGKAFASEASYWEVWLQNDPARKRLVEEAKTIHNSIRFRPVYVSDLETERSKLNRSIDEFELSKKYKVSSAFTHRRSRYSVRIAAIMVLLLAVLVVTHAIYPESEVQQKAIPTLLTTHTGYGQKKILTLHDGSTIILNANSSLTYPPKYPGEDLEVWLKGEAYFDIVHETDPDHRKFTVHTADGKMSVLGTKFNVSTYRTGTKVVLEEGKVRVELRDTLNQLQSTHNMEPGDLSQFVYSGRSIQVRKVKPELYTSWIQDKLVFDRTPLSQVAERIEYIYGVHFPVTDSELRHTRISGSVPNDNLPVFLNALGKMLQRPVTNENGTIRLGTPWVQGDQE